MSVFVVFIDAYFCVVSAVQSSCAVISITVLDQLRLIVTMIKHNVTLLTFCCIYRQSFHPTNWNHSSFPFGLCSSPFSSTSLFGPGHFGESETDFCVNFLLNLLF